MYSKGETIRVRNRRCYVIDVFRTDDGRTMYFTSEFGWVYHREVEGS